MNIAIIVAAGTGSRFSPAQPKQFTQILGKPLLIHTVECFEACPAVDEIVLVLSNDGREQFQMSNFVSEISKVRSIVTGGATRAESVKNGLDAIDAALANVVAVHDGARPLVTVDEITRTIVKADEIGAACLVAEVTDTIKEIREGVIVGTVDRNKLRRALTPQAFRYDILQRAFANADLGDNVTDECYLVEKLGVEIAMVEGSSRNIKITRAEDIRIAEMFLSEPPALAGGQ
ncbi:MAG TPA: 2-C-methyl-D-erythritol 4-phosphate cytidylyltransferase [Pyrinomonadaceae bacterium]|nr:2-C-methyl-D-erythritol 4-phosphate cytidylyltransferase [Pyrinomonadaceae bacterium]